MARVMQIEGSLGSRPAQSVEVDVDTAWTELPAADAAKPVAREEIAPIETASVAAVAPAKPDAAPAKPASRRKFILAGVLALALLGGGYYGYQWWTNGRFMVSTDDAYVSADTATVTPKIAGYVKSVPVADNSRVAAGTPLVLLDDSDQKIALAQAEAQIATEEASLARIGEQVLAGQAAIGQAEAQLASARAASDNAKAQYDRVDALAAKSFASTKDLEAGKAAMLQAQSAVAAAEAGVSAAHANVAVVEAQKAEAARVLDQYKLARDQAQLNLDHTIIRAPFDGMVGNHAAEPGEYVQAGQRLLALVPLDQVYVDANFKETQLNRLAPGQTVAITVDAYPDRIIQGTVESVAPASGSVFSLLPADNATGNFTKIVQRVPVRIRLPADVAGEGLIRPGMSIVAEVDTRTGPAKVAAR